jgi:hypothetical protein
MIAPNAASEDSAAFEEIDKLIKEMMVFRLTGEVPARVSVIHNSKVTGRVWRLPRAQWPLCGARTRTGSPCKRPGLRNGRSPNHVCLSSGPKTKGGKRPDRFCAKTAVGMEFSASSVGLERNRPILKISWSRANIAGVVLAKRS